MLETYTPSVLQLTEGAINKILTLSETEESQINLRVYVTGGGCSGFQYGFSFDKLIDEEDTCITNSGASLVVDPLSLQYLSGSTIDYIEDLTGSKFIIKNPNATTTCGCGESFSI
jgi:iron-sulfur cluster assembly accessory protein|tara:strand:- start:4677 stop:5021 length:345 start_codon:yes stop_codon:yes gene_type:complete